MTDINSETAIGVPKAQSNMSKLAVGAKITAEIARSTRFGLEVQFGQTKYLLKSTTNLQDAGKITLSVTKQLNDGGYKVQILGLNDRPLKNPIQGELASKPKVAASQDSPATITKNHRIDVVARLATIEGKAHGPTFAVHIVIPSESEAYKIPRPSTVSILPQLLNSSSTGNLTPEVKASRPANPPMSLLEDQAAGKSIGTTSLGQGIRSEHSSISPPGQSTSFNTPQLWGTAGRPKTSSQTMTAVVVGREVKGGGLLLKADTGQIFKVEQSINLPIGATLQLTLASSEIPFAGNQTMNAGNPISRLIKLLEEIEKSGTSITSSQQSNLAHQLPRPDRHLAGRLLQLINLQQASTATEPGSVAQQRDDTSLPKQDFLRSFLSDIGHAMTDPLADGWRGTALPLGSDPAQAIMIYYREHMADLETDDSSDEEQQSSVQRAVFDINFKHLGRCQIDALCQEQRLDIQVRSEQPFSSEDQQMITNLFTSACEIAGFKGDIGYKQGQFVEPPKKSLPGTTVTT